MPRCPQCRDDLDDGWFQYPVKTCLACYVSLFRNEDLLQQIIEGRQKDRPEQVKAAWVQVRRRAANSEYARKKRLRERTEGLKLEVERPTPVAFREETASSPASIERATEALPCDSCGKLTDDLSELDAMQGEEKAIVCKACQLEPHDKRCALCQKLFPLVSMRAKEGKFYCLDDISVVSKSPMEGIRELLRR